jgi:hypothetical protein
LLKGKKAGLEAGNLSGRGFKKDHRMVSRQPEVVELMKKLLIIMILLVLLLHSAFAGGFSLKSEDANLIVVGFVAENASAAYIIDKLLSSLEAESNYWGTLSGCVAGPLIATYAHPQLIWSGSLTEIAAKLLLSQIVGGYLGHRFLFK